MMRHLLFFCLALCLLPGGALAQNSSDLIIEPGVRAGPVTRDMTEERLKTLLPRGQVRRVLRNWGENYYACGTEIFAGTPHAAFISWASFADKDYIGDTKENREDCMSLPVGTHPQTITLEVGFKMPLPRNSWRTKNGIRLGSSLTDLETLATKPFEFSVCPCETGGLIMEDRLDEINSSLFILRIGFPENAYKSLEKFMKDPDAMTVMSSDVPKGMAQKFFVERMRVSLDPGFPVAKP